MAGNEDQEKFLLLCEIDSLDRCIDQWLLILERLTEDKRAAPEYYRSLREVGADNADREAEDMKLTQYEIDQVVDIIKHDQASRSKALTRLEKLGN